MPNILITGSNGQLGSEIKDLAKSYKEFSFTFTDVEELDLTDKKAIASFFENGNFDYCINCAAYTAVDQAEDQETLAEFINSTAVSYLAEACSQHNTLLVHISTDYVFDGNHYKPYVETDLPAPDSAYGRTKFKGEQQVLKKLVNVIIIRTSWLYSVYGNNFVKTMLRLGKEREKLGVVVDQIGTPTYAGDLAKAILDILQENKSNTINEIYHYSNEGVISWYDFAKAIMHQGQRNCSVYAIESKDFQSKANRPFYSVLNKTKIKTDFGIEIPFWFDSLKKVVAELEK